MAYTGTRNAFRYLIELAGIIAVEINGEQYTLDGKYNTRTFNWFDENSEIFLKNEDIEFDIEYGKVFYTQGEYDPEDTALRPRCIAKFTIVDAKYPILIEITSILGDDTDKYLEIDEPMANFENYLDSHFERQPLYVLK